MLNKHVFINKDNHQLIQLMQLENGIFKVMIMRNEKKEDVSFKTISFNELTENQFLSLINGFTPCDSFDKGSEVLRNA